MEVLHPKLVHLPLALSMLMPLLGGALTLSWWRGWLPRRVWIIALALHITLTLSAFAAMQSGEDEQNVAERAVSGELIRAHEESASALLWLSVVALFSALIATISETPENAVLYDPCAGLGSTLAAAATSTSCTDTSVRTATTTAATARICSAANAAASSYAGK